METTLLVAAITSLATVLGSTVTGVITYLVMRRQDEVQRLRRHLRLALLDVAAFHRLEALAIGELAEHEAHHTPESIKRRLRRTLRESGQQAPSYRATEVKSLESLQRLGLDH